MIYISGPIRSKFDGNQKEFNRVAKELREQFPDDEVYNPWDNGNDPEIPWENYLKEDIKVLSQCDSLVLLDDWEISRGACLEVAVAMFLRLNIYDEFGSELDFVAALQIIDNQEQRLGAFTAFTI